MKSDRDSFRGIRDKIIFNLILKHNVLVSVEIKDLMICYLECKKYEKYVKTGNLFYAPNGIDD